MGGPLGGIVPCDSRGVVQIDVEKRDFRELLDDCSVALDVTAVVDSNGREPCFEAVHGLI